LGEIDVLLLLGELRGHQENLAGTEELHKALAQARSIGDVWRQARVLGELGWSQPDFQQALASWEEATRLFRQVGDWHNLVVYLGVLANSLISNDEIESARKYLEEASTLTQQLKGKTEMASILTAYGRIALIEGDFEGARTKFQECAVTADELGNHSEYVWTNTLLGYVALRERNKTAARDYFYNCLREFHTARDVEGLAYVMEAVAILFSEVGQLKRSAQLIGWTNARHEERGYRRPKLEQEDVDKVILACIAKLGKAAFSEAYEEGKKMSLDEAVAYALKD
jgi:tetratricopeptide (TPR) repeat protein